MRERENTGKDQSLYKGVATHIGCLDLSQKCHFLYLFHSQSHNKLILNEHIKSVVDNDV